MSELYGLPDGWEWKKLIESVNISNKTVTINDNKEYHCIGLEHIESNTGKLVNFTLSNGEEIKSSKVTFEKNMVLYGKLRPYLNKVWTAEFDGIATTEILPFKPIENVLDSNYLSHYLRTSYFINNAMKNISGARMPRITTKYIKNEANIPLPPLQEQKRIVSKLDTLFEKIDKAIALHQKNMDEADVFMGSVLNEVFGELDEKYEIITVEELCIKITDGTHATPTYIDIGIPFLSVKNISKGIISFQDTRFVSKEEHLILSKRCNVERDDILYTKVGTTGIAKVVDTDKEFSIFVSIALLKPKKELIISMFFQYILNSPNCYEQSQSRTRGVANRNLVLKDIKQISFPLPPLNIQQKTVNYLDQLSEKTEKVKSVQKEKMESLKALKASLLDRAFRGEL